MKLDGTLYSILTIKLANPKPCFKYEPSGKVFETAKQATMSITEHTSYTVTQTLSHSYYSTSHS